MKKILLILLFIPFILKGVDKLEPQSVKFNQYIIIKDSATSGYLIITSKSSHPASARIGQIMNHNGALERYTGASWLPLLGYTAENLANKGIANGYASLDATGKIPSSQITPVPLGYTFVESSMSGMLGLSTAAVGDICKRTDSTTVFILRDLPASTYNNWILLNTSVDNPVVSVNGQSGIVVLDAADVGAIDTEIDPVWVLDSSDYYKKVDVVGLILHKVNDTTQINGHALNGRVIISATDITTGTLPHAQLPALDSADIPNNGANTTGTSGGLKTAYIDWTSNTGGNMILNKPNVVLQGDSTSLYYSHHAADSLLNRKQNLADTTTYDGTKNDVAIERNARNDSILALRNLANIKYEPVDTLTILSTISGMVDSVRNITHDTAQILRDEFQRSLINTIIYAGTSPDGYILRSSDNGLTWSNLGSAGKGQPLAFCQLSNGDILYTTDEGYVVNYTKNTSVFISSYPIRCISDYDTLFIGLDNGTVYRSIDNAVTFTLHNLVASGSQINSIISMPGGGDIAFTSSGIYSIQGEEKLIQAGNFTSALQIPNTDTIYALTYAGNVFRSINAGTSWTDLGDQGAANSRFIAKGLGSRIIIGYGSTVMIYSDNGFSTIGYLSSQEPEAKCLITTGNRMVIGQSDYEGDGGKISYSDDNGVVFTDLGQQYSQDSINCILATTGSTYVQPGDLTIYETKAQHAADSTLQRAWMDGLEARKLAKADTNHFLNEDDSIYAAFKLLTGTRAMQLFKTIISFALDTSHTSNKIVTWAILDSIFHYLTIFDSIACGYAYNDGETGIAWINNAPTATAIKNIGRSINTDTVIIKKGKPLIFRSSTLNTNTLNDIRIVTNSDTLNFSWWSGSAWVAKFKITPTGQLIQSMLTGSLTDGTPTAAEINSITSLTPATAGRGYRLYILDSDGTGLVYEIVSDGSNWQYSVKTKAI